MNAYDKSVIFQRKRVAPSYRRQREHGIILFVTMIALLILMITGIALVRSFDSSLILSGNIAFKRDEINQGERAMAAAIATINPGGALSTDALRQSNSLTNNYSASVLASDNHGIPSMLTDPTLWTSGGMTHADITDTTTGMTIRYVIDRMCSAAGATNTTNCMSFAPKVIGGDNLEQRAIPATLQTNYRISVRVTNANNTQTYLQSTGFH